MVTSVSDVSFANMHFTNANSGNGTVNDVDNPTFNNAAQAAINLNDVARVTFTNVVLDGGGGAGGAQVGINGQNVASFTIANSTVTGFGDAAGEGAVKLWNLTELRHDHQLHVQFRERRHQRGRKPVRGPQRHGHARAHGQRQHVQGHRGARPTGRAASR